MKSKFALVAVLWMVFGFAVTAVWRMFGEPVDYAPFLFWSVVIALAFVPALLASYDLASVFVNGDDLDPEADYDIDNQLDQLRIIKADAGVVWFDRATCFIFQPDDERDGWYVAELLDCDAKCAVMDRQAFWSRGQVFDWIRDTSFLLV